MSDPARPLPPTHKGRREWIKLVSDDYTTRDGLAWPIGRTVRATGERGQGICTSEYLHVYASAPMAALMAPCHWVDHYTRALVVRGVSCATDGTKHGLRQAVVLREIPRPTLSLEQCVAIAIVAAARSHSYPLAWHEWAAGWLSGRDRSGEAAWGVAAWVVAAWSAATWSVAAAARAAACAAAGVAWSGAAEEAAETAEHAAHAGADLPAICKLVLSTPEEQWEGLLKGEKS